MAVTPRYWHGGTRGLRVGDRILPPSSTGVETGSLTAYGRSIETGEKFLWSQTTPLLTMEQRSTSVFITTERVIAEAFAAGISMAFGGPPRTPGALYRVDPEEPLEDDPDYPGGVSFRCPAATIVAIGDPVVTIPLPKLIRRVERFGVRTLKSTP